jgi:hypothetical protein
MVAALRSAGFEEVRRCAFGDSDDPMFLIVEDESRFMDGDAPELAIECRRSAVEARDIIGVRPATGSEPAADRQQQRSVGSAACSQSEI